MSNRTALGRIAAVFLVVAMLIAALPATAREQCLADGRDDLLDLVTGQTVANPNADIEAMCVDHTTGAVTLSARLGAATDVATHPAWEPGRSALVFQVDVDPAADDPQSVRDYDVAIGRSAGVAAYTVTRVDDGEVMCGDAFPTEGLPTAADPTFRLVLDTARCLPSPGRTAPDVLRAGAFVIFAEAGGNPTLDEVPEDGALYGTALGTEDRPDVVGVEGVVRLSGRTRIETAIATSRQAFPTDGTAGAVVLATGQPPTPDGQPATSSPDALAAAPLATHTNAPLLLLGPPSDDQLAGDVLAEIQRVLPAGRTVYLVGGSAVIVPQVETDLRTAGYTPVRLAGQGREATSLAVALEIDAEPTRIVLADGGRFEFALLGAAYAASANIAGTGPDGPAGNAVLLLTTADSQGNGQIHPVYADYLRTDRPGREFVAVGQVAAAAAQRAGLPVAPANQLIVPGDDVFETSLAVAGRYGAEAGPPTDGSGDGAEDGPAPLPRTAPLQAPTTVLVANGLTYPDAIPGAALAGRFRAPLLFSWPDSLPVDVRAWLRDSSERMDPGFVLGGTAALRDAVAEQLSVCGTLSPDLSTPECRRK